MLSPRAQAAIMPWLVVAGLFLLWELLVVAARLPPFVLPAPTTVFAALAEFSGPIAHHALHTLGTTLAGFALSVAGGVALGVAVGSSAAAYRALFPVLIGFNSIPRVAIVPILVIWFGIGAVPPRCSPPS